MKERGFVLQIVICRGAAPQTTIQWSVARGPWSVEDIISKHESRNTNHDLSSIPSFLSLSMMKSEISETSSLVKVFSGCEKVILVVIDLIPSSS